MIYLDHAAATPVDPRVLKVMLPYFSEKFANPSAVYQFALQNRQAIDGARKRVADILNCKANEIYFTGSGTESNNWAIFGTAGAAATCRHQTDSAESAGAQKGRSGHLITSVVEHHSVLYPFEELERRGWKVTYLNVDEHGRVSLEKLKKALTPETALVSIAYANNEIGTVENIAEIGKFLKEYREQNANSAGKGAGTLFHTDACQAAGALSINVKDLHVDLMTINGGKIYGTKGSAVLYIRDKVKIVPLLYGGGQEHRQRAGTENVAGIVGFAEALEIAETMRVHEAARLTQLRDKLIAGLQTKIPKTRLNGDPVNRLPNNISISFEGVDAESLLLRLDMAGVCASAGSACTSGALEPSHVLMALGIKTKSDIAQSTIRMTLGRENTDKEIEKLLKIIPPIVESLRTPRGNAKARP